MKLYIVTDDGDDYDGYKEYVWANSEEAAVILCLESWLIESDYSLETLKAIEQVSFHYPTKNIPHKETRYEVKNTCYDRIKINMS